MPEARYWIPNLVDAVFSRLYSSNAKSAYIVTNRIHDGSPDDVNRTPWLGISRDGYLDTNLLPEGKNQICVAAWDHPDALPNNPSNRTLSENECRGFIVAKSPIVMYDDTPNILPAMDAPPTPTSAE